MEDNRERKKATSLLLKDLKEQGIIRYDDPVNLPIMCSQCQMTTDNCEDLEFEKRQVVWNGTALVSFAEKGESVIQQLCG